MGWFLPSHMDSGFIFGLLGLWHVYSILSSYISDRRGFRSRAWYPAQLPGRLRALELWILLFIVVAFISKQLSRAASDLASGVIHTEHLMRFQHVAFSAMYLVYISVALINEGLRSFPLPDGVLQGTFALGFLCELIVFHFGHHPGDDLEHYVHMLMQLILAAVVLLMFLEIRRPSSIVISLARSMTLVFKGTWFFYIGVLINVPFSIPLGCSILEDHDFPSCEAPMANRRAKAIQVLVFIFQAVVIVVLTYGGYGILRLYLGDTLENANYEVMSEEAGEDGSQVYFVVDKDGDFADAVDKAGVPLLKDLPRSLSRRMNKRSASNTPVFALKDGPAHKDGHAHKDSHPPPPSPLSKNLLMVSSPLPKNLKNV